MAICEMCGRTDNLCAVLVEGVALQVCPACSHYGIIQNNHHSPNTSSNSSSSSIKHNRPLHTVRRAKPEAKVVDNYAPLLRSIREKQGLSQADFALLLQEKESFISKWESGSLKPDIATAQKLQRLLGITLIVLDEAPATAEGALKTKSGEFTLGDFIKVKKREKS